MKPKQILYLTLASASMISAPLAQAQFSGYQPDDVTLVVWANNYDSVNFDLGNVSQFSTTASLTVSDFSASAVESALDVTSLSGLSFNLGAASTANYIPYITETVSPNFFTSGTSRNFANNLNNYGTDYLGSSGSDNYSIYPYTSSSAYNYNNNVTREETWNDSTVITTGSVYTTLPGTVGDGGTSGSASIDFYQVGVGTDTLLGDFTLNDTGTLTFSGVDAVPEPSTYALSSAGLLVLAWRSRLNRKNT